jgi:hypothetical protein
MKIEKYFQLPRFQQNLTEWNSSLLGDILNERRNVTLLFILFNRLFKLALIVDYNWAQISDFHGGEYKHYSLSGDIAPCILIEVDRCFRDENCLRNQDDHDRPDEGGSTHHWNVGLRLPDYIALYPRSLSSIINLFAVEHHAVNQWNTSVHFRGCGE